MTAAPIVLAATPLAQASKSPCRPPSPLSQGFPQPRAEDRAAVAGDTALSFGPMSSDLHERTRVTAASSTEPHGGAKHLRGTG
jgi:hypothetical protein